VESLLQAWIAAAVLAAVVFGTGGLWLGGRELREARRTTATVIFAAVKLKLDAALRVTGPASIAAAEALHQEIQLYLGPLLAFGTGGGRVLDQLKKAIDGRVRDAAAPTITVAPAPGQPPAAAASSSAACGAAAASASAGGTLVTVATPPPSPPPPPERDASTREHAAQVRAALEAFAAFWTQPTIERMLREAQAALLIRAPLYASDEAAESGAPTPRGRPRLG
jgi:hypothetical protein